MCGITGIFNRSGEAVRPEVLRKMTSQLAHRGPDGEGYYINNFIGLGHRRLAILDPLERSNQPMLSYDQRVALSYNGEIHNFKELRRELESRGHKFRSESDTEVVLNSYIEWGIDCLERFNGMFAFGIWDEARRTLVLARDRFGIKPLYYTANKDRVIFASEVKGILASPDVKSAIDLEGLQEYMTFQNFFSDRTLFENVKLLPAGSFAEVRYQSSNPLEPNQYWDFGFYEASLEHSPEELVEELEALLLKAVERQLVADVEIGSYLSGGIDSGFITRIASRKLDPLYTFTCGFDLSSASGLELYFDERQAAEELSYICGTEHYEAVLKSGDLERVIPKLVWHLEEPRVGQTYPNFYAAKLASKFVTVVLSGIGGDELFGGYPWRYYRAVVNDDFEDYVSKYCCFWQRLIPNTAIDDIFKPIWPQVPKVWTLDIFKNVFTTHQNELQTPADYVNHSLYLESKTFLHGLLVVEDKLSMAHGLETRVPFLDNDLVDFAMKIPVSMKLNNLDKVIRMNENSQGNKLAQYYAHTKDGKQILRKAMSRTLPPSITERVKQGFSAPDSSWFKGESIEYVKSIVLNRNSQLYDFLDFNVTTKLVKQHLNGEENRRLLIWSLLYLENWCQIFLKENISRYGETSENLHFFDNKDQGHLMHTKLRRD